MFYVHVAYLCTYLDKGSSPQDGPNCTHFIQHITVGVHTHTCYQNKDVAKRMLEPARAVSGRVDILERGETGVVGDTWRSGTLYMRESWQLEYHSEEDGGVEILGNMRQCARFERICVGQRQCVLRLQWREGAYLFVDTRTEDDLSMWLEAFESACVHADDAIRSFLTILNYHVTFTAGHLIGHTGVYAASAFHADNARRV
jgi:hypothetical protein